MSLNRRSFMQSLAASALALTVPLRNVFAAEKNSKIIKPPKLNPGDTVGLITPASPPFETHQTIIEATEKMNNLGFDVKLGKHVYKKWGYLAGTDEERVEDIHNMFLDDEVKAIICIRGGWGSSRLLKLLDYDLIKNHPKIFHGYSDITSLLIAVQQKTGLVTFHGPVATSTYTDFTKKYFLKTLTETQPVGEIEDVPYEENLQTTNRVWTVKGGQAKGRITGGNLTLIAAAMGTPFEIDTMDKILFIEEVDEEPHVLDRYLTQLDNAGKLELCRGIVFDKMKSVHPADYKPGYYSSLSVEEIILDRFSKFNIPVCYGLSLGHIANKPTLPLGIMAELDADKGRVSLTETAVI